MKNDLMQVLLAVLGAFFYGESNDADGFVSQLKKARNLLNQAVRDAEKSVRLNKRFAARAARPKRA